MPRKSSSSKSAKRGAKGRARASADDAEFDGAESVDVEKDATARRQVLESDKLYYRIGEVSRLTGVKAHVLRYWETEFRWMAPPKSRSKQRLYRKRDIEFVWLLKRLLWSERYHHRGRAPTHPGPGSRGRPRAPRPADRGARRGRLRAGGGAMGVLPRRARRDARRADPTSRGAPGRGVSEGGVGGESRASRAGRRDRPRLRRDCRPGLLRPARGVRARARGARGLGSERVDGRPGRRARRGAGARQDDAVARARGASRRAYALSALRGARAAGSRGVGVRPARTIASGFARR